MKAFKHSRGSVNRYPFTVLGHTVKRAIIITAKDFKTALNKILSLYPNKFVTTTYAKNVEKYLTRLNDSERIAVVKNKGSVSVSLVSDTDLLDELTPRVKTKLKHKLFMDLVNARKEAAKKSRSGKAVFINVDEGGECILADKQDKTTYAVFKAGSEIALALPLNGNGNGNGNGKKKAKKAEAEEEEIEEEEIEETEEEEETNEEATDEEEAEEEKPKKKAKKKADKFSVTMKVVPHKKKPYKKPIQATGEKQGKKQGKKATSKRAKTEASKTSPEAKSQKAQSSHKAAPTSKQRAKKQPVLSRKAESVSNSLKSGSKKVVQTSKLSKKTAKTAQKATPKKANKGATGRKKMPRLTEQEIKAMKKAWGG